MKKPGFTFAAKARRRAFTLVELLVVIAIIGLLSTVAVVSLDASRKKARDAKRLGDMRQVLTAIELYYNTYGSYPVPDLDGCGGWDIGNKDYPFMNGQLPGIMNNPPRDPTATGNCTGYQYYRYTPGTAGCDAARGDFFVLGVTDLEATSGPYPGSPGWSCPSRNWQSEMEWVTGGFTL